MATWFDESVLRPEVAGLVGGVLGLFNAPGANWRERMFNLVAGVSAAWFLAPALADYLDIDSKNGQMASSFVVGLVGMNLLAKAIAYVRRTPIAQLINLRAPPPPPSPRRPTKKESEK